MVQTSLVRIFLRANAVWVGGDAGAGRCMQDVRGCLARLRSPVDGEGWDGRKGAMTGEGSDIR